MQQTKNQTKKQTNNVQSKENELPKYSSSYHGTTANEKYSPIQKLYYKISGDRPPETVYDTIPYLDIYPDGICHVKDNFYSKMIRFHDINYKLATIDIRNQIYQEYCTFLNYFDDSVSVQLFLNNQAVDMEEQKKRIHIPIKGDETDYLAEEFQQMLETQMEKGNNGIIREKYIVFGCDCENRKQAAQKLSALETEILNRFKRLGCKIDLINGTERLKIMHDYMNQDDTLPFMIKSLNQCKTNGISPKCYISPSSFDFRNTREFKIGELWGSVVELSIDATEIDDEMLMEILSSDATMNVSIFLNSINQQDALKYVKQKLADVNKDKIEEQKKAIRSGYDMDILPPDLETYTQATKDLLDSLQQRNERLFNVTVFVTVYHHKLSELKLLLQNLFQKVQSKSCSCKWLDHMQEQAWQSSLPLGMNHLPDIKRGVPTSGVGALIPFTTQELFQDDPEAEYLGLNALSNGLIMANRKLLNNPNGLILGKPGSGKSFAAKRSILNSFIISDDDVIICDPEAEYFPLVTALDGTVIKISQNADTYINPLDINLDVDDDGDALALKSEFIYSMMELIIGSPLKPEEKSCISMCIRQVYQKYTNNPIPENMPTLQDMYEYFTENSENPTDRFLSQCLFLYTEGSSTLFNHRTNIEINNRIVCFDIKELGASLKKLGMLIVQETVWDRVKVNRMNKKSTRYFIDEFHLLLRDEQTTAYSVEIWKRFRKWGGIPTGITQNIKDFLQSKEIENIFDNSDFVMMLNQGAGDAEILADKFNIGAELLQYILNRPQGEGLIFYGDLIMPFVDRFPTDTTLYKLMTTKPEESVSESDIKNITEHSEHPETGR